LCQDMISAATPEAKVSSRLDSEPSHWYICPRRSCSRPRMGIALSSASRCHAPLGYWFWLIYDSSVLVAISAFCLCCWSRTVLTFHTSSGKNEKGSRYLVEREHLSVRDSSTAEGCGKRNGKRCISQHVFAKYPSNSTIFSPRPSVPQI
jgi:hypothetical protein